MLYNPIKHHITSSYSYRIKYQINQIMSHHILSYRIISHQSPPDLKQYHVASSHSMSHSCTSCCTIVHHLVLPHTILSRITCCHPMSNHWFHVASRRTYHISTYDVESSTTNMTSHKNIRVLQYLSSITNQSFKSKSQIVSYKHIDHILSYCMYNHHINSYWNHPWLRSQHLFATQKNAGRNLSLLSSMAAADLSFRRLEVDRNHMKLTIEKSMDLILQKTNILLFFMFFGGGWRWMKPIHLGFMLYPDFREKNTLDKHIFWRYVKMVQNVPQPCLKICSWKLFTGRELPGEPWTVGGTCQKKDEATHKWCFLSHSKMEDFHKGSLWKKNNPKFMFTTIFGGGIDHRSDRFYAYSTISKLEMTMMGIEYLLIFFRSGFFVDSRMLPLTLAKETFCSNQWLENSWVKKREWHIS